MLINGLKNVIEAFESGVTIEMLYVEKGSFSANVRQVIELAKQKNIKIFYMDKAELDAMAKTKSRRVLAKVNEYQYCDLEEILSQQAKPHFLLILDQIQDPHNLGAIIRSAEIAGVTGIIIPKHRSAYVNDTVIRTSAGATAHVKIAKVTNINDTIRTLKDLFITVYAADMNGEFIYKENFTSDLAIIIGNEGMGVRELTRKLADKTIAIPQLGKLNSLNASVACGIILYEVVRQRLNIT